MRSLQPGQAPCPRRPAGLGAASDVPLGHAGPPSPLAWRAAVFTPVDTVFIPATAALLGIGMLRYLWLRLRRRPRTTADRTARPSHGESVQDDLRCADRIAASRLDRHLLRGRRFINPLRSSLTVVIDHAFIEPALSAPHN